MGRPWQEIVAAKVGVRDVLIREHSCNHNASESEFSTTEISDVTALTKLLASGRLSAEEVIRAYIHQSVIFSTAFSTFMQLTIDLRACRAHKQVS